MPDPDLNFIAQQLANVLAEQRGIRAELATLPAIRDELTSLRGEIGLVREEVRLVRGAVARLDDTIRMNVLPRLQALEEH